jgi:hypothetical protein
VGTTGQPKAGKNPKNSANWAGNGPRPAKALPKSRRIAEDDSDDDKGASVGHPRCKARAAKCGRGTVGVTGQPKAGQDPHNPANWAGDGLCLANVTPKIGRGVPARTAFGGHSLPVKIVNGSSRDKASFARKAKFASKEEDDEGDPDKDIVTAARFALGVVPSDKAWAAAARLPGAVVVRRALAALRDNTNNEASLAATSDSKAAAQATLATALNLTRKPSLGSTGRPKREGHMRKEAGRATKRKSHHPGGPSPQVLTADKDADIAANWQAEEGGHPSGEASWATKRKANHMAHQGGGTRSPQLSMALFGPTKGKNQGRTGQRGSAAFFF